MKSTLMIIKLLFIVLPLSSTFGQTKVYVDYVRNDFGDTLGYTTIIPQNDSITFFKYLNSCIKAYFKQLPKTVTTYNVYLRTNPMTKIIDTMCISYPPAKFLIQKDMTFLKQEDHIIVHEFDFGDFCNYLSRQWGCDKKY